VYNSLLKAHRLQANQRDKRRSSASYFLPGKVLMCDPLPRRFAPASSKNYPKGCLNVSPLWATFS